MSKKHKKQLEDKSLKISQRDKIKEELIVREFNWTDKQKIIIDGILNHNSSIIFVQGKAGTSKTLIAVYCALKLLNSKKVSELIYVRSVIESASRSMGALPGLAEEKFHPYLMPLEDKLDELLPKNQINKLIEDKRIQGIPINFLRGGQFNAKVVIGDELQNMTNGEILTLITRTGKFSKLILCGDFSQSDINGKSGFKHFFDLFNDEESRNNGIYCFEFGIEDVMRSGVVRYILEKMEKSSNNSHVS